MRFNIIVFWCLVGGVDLASVLSSRSRGGGNYSQFDDYRNEQTICIHTDSRFGLNGNKLTEDGI